MKGNSGREIEIFTEAVQLPAAERFSFLDRVCGADEGLRLKIEALLKSNDRAGAFLEEPPSTAIGEGRAKAAPGEKPGDRIDCYKLLQQIGEGGCGVVFLAEQEEPVRRQVALKVVKPGMDTKSVIARFEAERQALALMEHPNIAHVFDAGATTSGRPYFVMELVKGDRITDYCDKNSLATSERLQLFVQVCDAVQHAHQKGVIHRDIKPSNILVATTSDGKPAPKVIDFGIAKATTGQQLTDKTILTTREMLIGTPAYMSPEQAAFTSADADTRTDIYSLGVMLYELLTGTTPFDTHELLKVGLDEVRRVIRDEEPVRPSTRLSTMVERDLVNFSKHHGEEAPKLIREMRGDLDWIVMKALEKDRGRRYQTAISLAEDIQRYVEDETVSARPPSVAYQVQKLIARHKLGFAALAIVLTTLVAGLLVTTWSLSKEKRAHHDAELAHRDADEQREKAESREQKAVREAAKSREVIKFLDQMLLGVNPKVANGRDTSLLRDVLDEAAERVGRVLTNQPAVQADLGYRIARAYGFLGLWDKGEPMLNTALAYYRKSPDGAEQNLGNTLAALSVMHLYRADRRFLDKAEQEAREALAILSKLLGEENLQLVSLKTHVGMVLLQRGKKAEAEKTFREALATGQRVGGDESDEVLDTRNGLANALIAQGKPSEAEDFLRESLSVALANHGTNHLFTANCFWLVARVSEIEKKMDQAEDLYRQTLAIRRRLLPKDHAYMEESLEALARILINKGKMAEGTELGRELLEFRQKRYGAQDARVAEIVTLLAQIFTVNEDEAQFGQLAGEFPEAWVTRSEVCAQIRHWPEARKAAARFLEMRPADDKGYHLMAPLLVQAGERAAYEELCANITLRFAGATNIYVADRMAKDCLILPRPGADLKVPGDLAETAVAHGQGDRGALPFFQCCKALAEFRLAHYEEAVNWAHLATKGPLPHSRAEAAAIMAMSHFKLNQLDKATAALTDCNKVIEERLPKPEQGDLGNDWRDWIIAHALQSEAKQLIDDEGSAAVRAANDSNTQQRER